MNSTVVNTRQKDPLPPSIVDEMMEGVLHDWSGLRSYVRGRRAGAPADQTMEVLLSEVLRTRLHSGTDVRKVLRVLLAPRS